jgi:hypothetical protein
MYTCTVDQTQHGRQLFCFLPVYTGNAV